MINIGLDGKKFWRKVDRLFGATRGLHRGQFPSVQTEANGSSNLININGLSSAGRGITKSPLRMFLSVYLLATDCERFVNESLTEDRHTSNCTTLPKRN